MRAARLLFLALTLIKCPVWAQQVADTVSVHHDGDISTLTLTTSGTEIDSAIPDARHMDGQFKQVFNCSLEVLGSDHRWVKASDRNFHNYGPKPAVLKVKVGPGETLDVCKTALPQDGAAVGQCARLSFQYGWAKNGDAFVSEPFVIDNTQATLKSCGAS